MTPRFDAYDVFPLTSTKSDFHLEREEFSLALCFGRTVNFMWRLLYYTLLLDFTTSKCAITSTPGALWDLDVSLISWWLSTCSPVMDALPPTISFLALISIVEFFRAVYLTKVGSICSSYCLIPLAQHVAFLDSANFFLFKGISDPKTLFTISLSSCYNSEVKQNLWFWGKCIGIFR